MSMESKFKIGDAVRMTKVITGFDRLFVGKTGVVVASGLVGPRVKFGCGIDDAVVGCFDDQLEPVKEKEKEAEMAKYKVGDLVLVVGPEDPEKESVTDRLRWVSHSMKKFCGRVMRIDSIVTINDLVRYKLDGGDGWGFVDAWLKKWPCDEMPRFQKGDRVTIHDGSSNQGQTGTVRGFAKISAPDAICLIALDKSEGWRISSDWAAGLKNFGIYDVSREDGRVYWYNREHELIPLDGADAHKPDTGESNRHKAGEKAHTRRVVIEITEDGAKAKYIVGKKAEKEAEIRRYHEDRPDDAKAAKYAVEALFGNLKADEEAERAAKTAEVLRGMNWGDMLFRAICEGTKK